MKTRLNKIISTILVAVMLVTAAPLSGFVGLDLNLDWLNFTTRASAEELSGTCGDNLTWTLDTETGELLITGTGAMEDYRISNQPWYDYKDLIKSVVISDGITTIGNYAFNVCGSLKSITIPDSVTSVGDYAFTECFNLTSITIPDSVTSIGSIAFGGCMRLTSITIGNGVTSIGAEAFFSCTNLTSIIVDENNTAYSSDEYGVLFNKDKTELIQYPIGNTRTSYEIPDSVTSIGAEAFFSCASLTSMTIGDSVTRIGNHAFRDCSGLTSIIIGNSVTSVGDYAFTECFNLTSITIPDSVTTIGDSAFFACTSITSVTIGDSVTTIGDSAFYYCADLSDVYYNGSQEQWNAISIGSYNVPLTNATIHFKEVVDSGTCGDNLTWTLYDDGELLITGTGAMYDYGYGVSPWYDYRSSIKSVNISDSVTAIGDYTFQGCTNLISVTIGNGVTTIGNYAFFECYSLKSVTIPDSVTVIGDCSFAICTSLTDVMIPDGVTTIESGAFSNCLKLTSVTIPKSVISIGIGAFALCRLLTEIVVDNKNPAYSSDEYGVLFTKDKNTLLQYPVYNESTFYMIPDGVTSIGYGAFAGHDSLANIVIPDGVTTIENLAFYGCTRLNSITIPDSVASIGDQTFAECPRLADVYFGGTEEEWNAIEIGGNNESFLNANIHFTGEMETVIYSGTCGDNLTWSLDTETGELLITGTGAMKNYSSQSSVPWYSYRSSIKSVTISDGVTTIGNWAFYNCASLTSVTIGDSVTTIGYVAFYHCTSLTSVTIPDSVTTIGNEAFMSCDSLISVTIGKGVTTMGYNMFIFGSSELVLYVHKDSYAEEYAYNNYYVYYYVYSENEAKIISVTVTSKLSFEINKETYTMTINCIGDMPSFASADIPWKQYEPYIKHIIISDDCTGISNSSFSSMKGVRSVTISDSVTTIGNEAFYGCTRLTSVTIPDSVTTIGGYAFYYCTSLTSVTMGDSVTTIGYYAFQDCTGLTSVTIPDSVTTIREGAFYNCTSLTSVIIPDSVTTIGGYAFYYCTSLTSVTMGNSVTSIGSYAFNGCSNLINVVLPFSVKNVYSNAFTDCKSLERLKVYSRDCVFETGCTSYYTTIVGYAGSTAEAYANENGFDFELIADDDHEHIYSNSCDAECNICGVVRTDLIHTYTYVCDANCDLCGHVRTDVIHTFDNGCDADCNVCGDVRTPKHTDENNDGICDVCEKSISDILVGVEQSFKVKAGETVYIKFIPANSGVYTYYSSSNSDTLGYVYDADKNQLAYNDDGGNGNNFSITYTFRAGTVYYLGVKYYNSSYSGEIPVTIRLDELICDHWNTYDEHKDSTCSEYGYDKVICFDCGATVSETTIDTKPHSYKTVVANPTCQVAGMVAYYCSVCKYSYISEITDPVDHLMSWEVVSKPTSTADGEMHYTCAYCDLVEATKVVPMFCISTNGVVNINFENNTISGFDAGSTSLDGYVSVENGEYTLNCDSEIIGTGTVIELTDGDVVIEEFTAVIFGDVNGDGWYDGTDSIIVSCLANGLLSKDDVSPAFYTAADCNHDGVIDSFDVALLEQAGLLLSGVDQSKSNEELATDEAYLEYLDLIDQTPDEDAVEEEETTQPEAGDSGEETETPEQSESEISLFEFIMEIIRMIFESIFALLG